MIIDCIADLHGHFPELEGGDLLIVAGDLTARDTFDEREYFIEWLSSQPYREKVFIAGNHDNELPNLPYISHSWGKYLCDGGFKFEGLKIYGSPWTLASPGINPNCTAFTGDEELLSNKFALIPDDVDILVTHGPPFTILDKTTRGEQVGSISLMVSHLKRLRPQLFVFGHIHEAYGQEGQYQWNNTKYVNCSHVNERYEPINKPIRIIL